MGNLNLKRTVSASLSEVQERITACNVVLRELSPGQISVEIAKPSSLMEFLGEPGLVTMAEQADTRLARALSSLAS